MSEEINFENEILRLLDRDPFVPFIIRLTSGDHYEVVNPRRVAWGANTVVVMHPTTGLSFFRKNQIVAVDAPETAA